uniref:MULE transposase domain-containing protein n=1 Tax=Lactuca sativa TaxID=4236 RepID=A0A9R1XND2_LACSA|nr:hypothetical protein LSAT_V11C400191570 [Lactuca sativa]
MINTMLEPLPLPELAQQNRKGAITYNNNSYMKLYQLFKSKETIMHNLVSKSRNNRDAKKCSGGGLRIEKEEREKLGLRPCKGDEGFQPVTLILGNPKMCVLNPLNFRRDDIISCHGPRVIKAFQRCLLPIIFIDGSHLKTKYLGTMFLAIGLDGTNQILPIAFGVGRTKHGESWIWFLSRLKECIGGMPSLAFISYRPNSNEITIKSVFPSAYHRLRCRHLLMNLREKIGMQNRI